VPLLALALLARSSSAQVHAVEASLDSLLRVRVSAASKYDQVASEAPASVTIISSDEIRAFGFRSLREALESVRGFYVSNDHNYPYLGTRGFGRPTDYNNRILLLVDGHTINDRTWGGAPVGTDFPIDLEAVERIEVVRGPGSVLYGTNAMFAVINIVTRNDAQLDGVRASVGGGSYGARQGTLSIGHTLAAETGFAISGIATSRDGENFYFPEFENAGDLYNGGYSRGLDWERGVGALASFRHRDVRVLAGFRSRSKGIPTGAYGVALNDRRAETVDETLWGEIAARHQLTGTLALNARLYADRYLYHGVYPGGPGTPYEDHGESRNVGGEALVTWDPLSRARFTFGTEYVDVQRASYTEHHSSGEHSGDDAPFSVLSFFVQNELQLSRSLALVTGIRHDVQSTDVRATTPRFAIIASPDSSTTVKLLYGEAFRSPSPAEANLETSFYNRNPALNPERIRTIEVELQRRVARPLLLGASIYHYWMNDLIDQVEIENPGGIQFMNIAKVEAVGVELQANLSGVGPFALQTSYALQRAEYEPGDVAMTNSPHHIGRLAVTTRWWSGITSALETRFESSRVALDGSRTSPFVRSDLSVGFAPASASAPQWMQSMDLSLRVWNLFDRSYYVPGGIEHAQSGIIQNGRALSLTLKWKS
jgi:iron complex outermembrane receptor protein